MTQDTEQIVSEKEQGILDAYETLEEMDTYPRHLQLRIADMKGGKKAVERKTFECQKGTVQYGMGETKTFNEEGQEHMVPFTIIVSGTKKPILAAVIGHFEDLIYSINKAEMELYQRYITLGVAIIVFGLLMIDLHLHMTPSEEITLDFWNNGWIMAGLTAALTSFFFLRAIKDDVSLDVFEGTAEVSDTPEKKVPSYVCTSSQMPVERKFALFGRTTSEGVMEAQLEVVQALRTFLAEQIRALHIHNRALRTENTTLSQRIEELLSSNRFYTSRGDTEIIKTRIESRHFLIALSIGASALVAIVGLLVYYYGGV